MTIRKHLQELHRQIEDHCGRAGRDPGEVTLIAVGKTKPVEMLLEAYEAGSRQFGENKVQELADKLGRMPEDVRWHFIGHLQTNKVKQLVGRVSLIQSVDSVRLAEEIEKESEKKEVVTDILLEINAAEEKSKFGFLFGEAEEAIRRISGLSHVKVCGLMTVAPFVANAEDNRPVFRKLNEFYVDMKSKNIDNVNMKILSMGMTGDFGVAVQEGATMVRVGAGLFGAR